MRKPIKNFEGLYDIDDIGNVYSLERKGVQKERILKVRLNTKGYVHVALYKDNKIHTFRVHRLVAETFLPNPENKPEVNHKDCNKLNNSVENLEWVTAKQNYNHAVDNGLKSKEWWYWLKNRWFINHVKSINKR